MLAAASDSEVQEGSSVTASVSESDSETTGPGLGQAQTVCRRAPGRAAALRHSGCVIMACQWVIRTVADFRVRAAGWENC